MDEKLEEKQVPDNFLSSMRFPRDDRILILSFANQKYQSQGLARISCFCEDQKRKGQVIDIQTFEELRDVPSKNYAGHNLPIDHILNFLRAIGSLSSCTEYEKRVVRELESQKYIQTAKGGHYSTLQTNAILIAFVESRIKDLKHEIQHGFFYVDPEYRKSCESVWASLPQTIRNHVQEPQTFSVSGTSEMLAARKTLASLENSQLVSRLSNFKDVLKLAQSPSSTGSQVKKGKEKPKKDKKSKS